MFLTEVDNACPICGKILKYSKQKKNNKLYEIAHIYPNSPTLEQFKTLNGLERLGCNCESNENKIALCKECHGTQDYHTTKEEYLSLLNKKKHLLQLKELKESTVTLGLEEELTIIIEKLSKLSEKEFEDIVMEPLPLSKKFLPEDFLLKKKVSYNVTSYYTYIRDLFRNIEGKKHFTFETLSMQIRSCFIKMSQISQNKEDIFSNIAEWIQKKTDSESTTACEILVSFFVQNCEVFNEITE